MKSQFIRICITLAMLASIYLLVEIPASAAKPYATQNGRTFLPSRHSFATAQKVSTAKVPQVFGAARKMAISHSNSSTPAPLPASTSIAGVPLPTHTDPTAMAGISEDNVSKPDGSGAGGTVNYMEAVNTEMAIYGRDGTLEYMTTFRNWFGINTPYHDPKVIWDNTGDRFIFSVNVGFELILSVAQQADATGKFCNYGLPTPVNGGLGADFDMLGVNGNGIYISANVLNPSTGRQVSNELFAANRTQMESCAKNAGYYTWTGLTKSRRLARRGPRTGCNGERPGWHRVPRELPPIRWLPVDALDALRREQ